MIAEKMEKLYFRIAISIKEMIQEDWIEVYLYSEVSENTSVTFFYYYPDQKSNPIYSRDIFKIFNLDEDEFEDLDFQLDNNLVELWKEFKNSGQEAWTNLTFILSNTGEFKVDYNYTDLSNSDLYENKIIWGYKNLGLKPQGERPGKIIENYILSGE